MPAPRIHRVEVVRTHLEFPQCEALRAGLPPRSDARVERATHLAARDYLAIYHAVGARWQWGDRLCWSDAQVEAYLALPSVTVYILLVGDAKAGFFELRHHIDGYVEIMYFGLTSPFMGCGLGGWMLTRAIEASLALGATSVRLHTCTLDAPQALPNYLARGFVIVREERYFADVPV